MALRRKTRMWEIGPFNKPQRILGYLVNLKDEMSLFNPFFQGKNVIPVFAIAWRSWPDAWKEKRNWRKRYLHLNPDSVSYNSCKLEQIISFCECLFPHL